jgi:hypothetical protein
VVVGDVPEFAGAPPVLVEYLSHLIVVENFSAVGAVDFQHSERLYNHLYELLL